MIGKASFQNNNSTPIMTTLRRWTSKRQGLRLLSTVRRLPPTQRALLSSVRPLSYEEMMMHDNEWEHSSKSRRTPRYVPNGSSYAPAHLQPLRSTLPVARSTVSTSEMEEELIESTTFAQTATSSPAYLSYAGDTEIPITSKLHLVMPGEDKPSGIWPAFRLMDQNGTFRDPGFDGYDSHHPATPQPYNDDPNDLDKLRSFLAQAYPFQHDEINRSGLLHPHTQPFADTQSTNTLLRAHQQMVRLRQMDSILLAAQRQGRISFYMACTGEEAIHMGAGSALDPNDPIFAQYREQGLLMWRGFTMEQFTNQCFSNDLDLGKGRQMPVHYGSRALQYHTVSSPLGTQLPQAVGAAYRLKLSGQPNIAICFFGDGCASTPDFHSAMNFAATLSAPVVFVCRNNGYAISTPAKDQYAGDGVVSRAPGYGMAAIRVDGNDLWAVHAAVREARAYALAHQAPVLIEAMTYRQGHHSTSDDSSHYRDTAEVQDCAQNHDPIARVQAFLNEHGLMTAEKAAAIAEQEKRLVLAAMTKSEARPKPSVDELFTDVYHELTPELKRQKAQLLAHMAKYPDKY